MCAAGKDDELEAAHVSVHGERRIPCESLPQGTRKEKKRVTGCTGSKMRQVVRNTPCLPLHRRDRESAHSSTRLVVSPC